VSSTQKISLTRFTTAHIEGVWRGVDIVARERKYLDKLEAASLEESREYLLKQIAKGDPRSDRYKERKKSSAGATFSGVPE
jgi:hypothetical protein